MGESVRGSVHRAKRFDRCGGRRRLPTARPLSRSLAEQPGDYPALANSRPENRSQATFPVPLRTASV
jgi:hypothetical protein